MSSIWIISLFIVAFVYSAYSGTYLTEPYQHTDYPRQCYDKEINEPVPVGKTSSNLKGCKWQQCQPDFRFVVTTCAPMIVPDGCTPGKYDLSQPYPKCCPRPIC